MAGRTNRYPTAASRPSGPAGGGRSARPGPRRRHLASAAAPGARRGVRHQMRFPSTGRTGGGPFDCQGHRRPRSQRGAGPGQAHVRTLRRQPAPQCCRAQVLGRATVTFKVPADRPAGARGGRPPSRRAGPADAGRCGSRASGMLRVDHTSRCRRSCRPAGEDVHGGAAMSRDEGVAGRS